MQKYVFLFLILVLFIKKNDVYTYIFQMSNLDHFFEAADELCVSKQVNIFPQILLKSEHLPFVPFPPMCSSSHNSHDNPCQGVVILLVIGSSPVFAGPWRCPVHNTTPGRPPPGWNPSVLSNQSALFKQELPSAVTEGFSQTFGAFQSEEREKISLGENKVWEQFWLRLQLDVAFWADFGYRSVSRQSVVRTFLLLRCWCPWQ